MRLTASRADARSCSFNRSASQPAFCLESHRRRVGWLVPPVCWPPYGSCHTPSGVLSFVKGPWQDELHMSCQFDRAVVCTWTNPGITKSEQLVGINLRRRASNPRSMNQTISRLNSGQGRKLLDEDEGHGWLAARNRSVEVTMVVGASGGGHLRRTRGEHHPAALVRAAEAVVQRQVGGTRQPPGRSPQVFGQNMMLRTAARRRRKEVHVARCTQVIYCNITRLKMCYNICTPKSRSSFFHGVMI